MKYQILFSGKNIINVSSAKIDQRIVKVNISPDHNAFQISQKVRLERSIKFRLEILKRSRFY